MQLVQLQPAHRSSHEAQLQRFSSVDEVPTVDGDVASFVVMDLPFVDMVDGVVDDVCHVVVGELVCHFTSATNSLNQIRAA